MSGVEQVTFGMSEISRTGRRWRPGSLEVCKWMIESRYP